MLEPGDPGYPDVPDRRASVDVHIARPRGPWIGTHIWHSDEQAIGTAISSGLRIAFFTVVPPSIEGRITALRARVVPQAHGEVADIDLIGRGLLTVGLSGNVFAGKMGLLHHLGEVELYAPAENGVLHVRYTALQACTTRAPAALYVAIKETRE